MEFLKSKWGKWSDISTGAINDCRYLLQARRHKDGKIQFRVEQCKGAWTCAQPTLEQLNEVVYDSSLKDSKES
jgi:hypothetical protein